MTFSSPGSLEKFGNSAPKFTKQLMKLRRSGNLQPSVVTLLVLFFCVYAGYRSGDFWSALNWQLLAQPLAEAGLASLGMMFVIASGGIDLSAGAIVGVAAVTAVLAHFGRIDALHANAGIPIPGTAGPRFARRNTRTRRTRPAPAMSRPRPTPITAAKANETPDR